MALTHGFDCHAVGDGREALEYLLKNSVELIITDIIMPDVEGIGLILSVSENYPELPVIAISGGGRIGTPEYLDMACELGAVHALRKPFENEELIAAVCALLPAKSSGLARGDS
ncbi:MAG: response regulator [Gallionellaceae bacterium]